MYKIVIFMELLPQLQTLPSSPSAPHPPKPHPNHCHLLRRSETLRPLPPSSRPSPAPNPSSFPISHPNSRPPPFFPSPSPDLDSPCPPSASSPDLGSPLYPLPSPSSPDLDTPLHLPLLPQTRDPPPPFIPGKQPPTPILPGEETPSPPAAFSVREERTLGVSWNLVGQEGNISRVAAGRVFSWLGGVRRNKDGQEMRKGGGGGGGRGFADEDAKGGQGLLSPEGGGGLFTEEMEEGVAEKMERRGDLDK